MEEKTCKFDRGSSFEYRHTQTKGIERFFSALLHVARDGFAIIGLIVADV